MLSEDTNPPSTVAAREAYPLLGQLVGGRYRVRSLIGEGGMGEVYVGVHETIEKSVAIKVLKTEYCQRPDVVERFQREAKSASRIKHPNVVDVFDFGQLADGRFFLILEYLQGVDLHAEMRRERPLSFSITRVMPIVLQIARALSAIHKVGIVHRDLKPENIFLIQNGDQADFVKILDFGIAQMRESGEGGIPGEVVGQSTGRRLTKAGTIFGTPEYMSPEQAAGRDVDYRSDVYSLGIILYEMFACSPPFTGGTLVELLSQHLSAPVPHILHKNPQAVLSAELEAVIMTALQKNREHRWPSMLDFAEALQQCPEFTGEVIQNMASGHVLIPSSSPNKLAEGNLHSNQETLFEEDATAAIPLVSARAQTASPTQATRSGQSSTPPSSGNRQRGLFLAVAVLGFAALAVVAVIQIKKKTNSSRKITTRLVVESTHVEASTPPATASIVIPPESHSAPTPKATVVIHIKTIPTGAVVRKDGFQVCDSTPCDIKVRQDEATELQATKGAWKGSDKLLAQREQNITIFLKRTSITTPPRNSGTIGIPAKTVKTAEPKLCVRTNGDLKELYPCPLPFI
jgi:eukaryotic-like serine/threonine-protein kinase